MRRSEIRLIFCVLSILTQCYAHQTHQIQTNIGPVVGTVFDSGFIGYMNLPYGKVDAGNYFGEAVFYPSGTSGFNATIYTEAVTCPQIRNGVYSGELDCLNLNVYTPTTATGTSKLPVIVFLHGGFLQFGSSSKNELGPKFLVSHDIVVVIINYRLGPYGFMCVDDVDVTGNQGLKDQYLALRWVKNNIEAFGGNPDDVTLAGHSAGAHSVDFHLLTNREKLFKKAIIQSGSSLATTVILKADKEAPLKIAHYLGLEVSSAYDALRRLSIQSPEKVLRAAQELGLDFKPCVERALLGSRTFLTDDWVSAPHQYVEDTSILIGFTEHEMIRRVNQELFTSDFIVQALNKTFDFDSERSQRMEQYVRRFYMGDKQIGQETVWPMINLDSDLTYNHPIQRTIRKLLDGNAKSIYYYMFAYSGDRNIGKIISNVNVDGAAGHSDELGYLFDIAALPDTVTTADQLMIDRMTTMWTNFAKYGDPTPDTSTLLPTKWVPLNNHTYNYMRIDTNMSLERRPLNRRMAFLDLFFKYNKEHLRTFENENNPVDGSNAATAGASLINIFVALIILIVTMTR